MKAIIELTRAITDDPVFYAKQFTGILGSSGSTEVTNILFLNPQLSGKHLYKMFLPYFTLASNPKIKTAIQHISKYNNRGQIIGGKETDISIEQITWANIIVFPFTTQPLVTEVYSKIRTYNPYAKIIYQIDFNFYEMSPKMPDYDLFTDDIILNEVENNAYFADVIMVANIELQKYLYDKFSEMVLTGKYKGVPSNVKIACQPLIVNDAIQLQNIDYNPEVLLKVTAKEIVPVAPIAQPAALTQKLEEIAGSNKALTEHHEAEKEMKQERFKRKNAEGSTKKASAKKVTPKKTDKPVYTVVKAKKNRRK